MSNFISMASVNLSYILLIRAALGLSWVLFVTFYLSFSVMFPLSEPGLWI